MLACLACPIVLLLWGSTSSYATDNPSQVRILATADNFFQQKDCLAAIGAYEDYLKTQNPQKQDYALYQLGLSKLLSTDGDLHYTYCRSQPDQDACTKKFDEAYQNYAKAHPNDFSYFEPAGSYFYDNTEFKRILQEFPNSQYAAMGQYHILQSEHVGDWEGTFPHLEFIAKDKAYLKKYPHTAFYVDILHEIIKLYTDVIPYNDNAGNTDINKGAVIKEAQDFYPEAEPHLAAALLDSRGDKRIQAAEALSLMSPHIKTAVPALVSALRDENLQVRVYAGKALLAFNPPDTRGINPLIEALHNADDSNQKLAIDMIRQTAPQSEAAIPDLIAKALSTVTDRWVRRDAAETLGEFPGHPKEIVPALSKLLKDPDYWLAKNAAHSLEKFGANGKEAVGNLIAMLKYQDKLAVSAAIRALMRIGPDAAPAIPALSDLAAKPVQSAEQIYASEALFLLKQTDSQPLIQSCLTALTQKKFYDAENAAEKVLLEIGTAANSAIPPLEICCNNNNERCCSILSKLKAANLGNADSTVLHKIN